MLLDGSRVIKKESFHFILNGAPWVTREKIYLTQTGELLVPLKPLAEKLGYQVQWRQDEKAVEVRTLTDAIVLRSVHGKLLASRSERRAYEGTTLETSGVIKAGKIYVPVTFFSEVMGGIAYISVGFQEGYVVTIDALKSVPEIPSIKGDICWVEEHGRDVRLFIKGAPYGESKLEEVVLSVEKSTKILSPMTGENKTAGDLHKGMKILAAYGQGFSKSAPPIGQALSIEILEGCDVAEGKIYDILKDEEGLLLRIIGTDDDFLIAGRDTVLTGLKQESLSREQLKVGMQVKVYKSEIASTSRPPTSKAFHIQLQKGPRLFRGFDRP